MNDVAVPPETPQALANGLADVLNLLSLSAQLGGVAGTPQSMSSTNSEFINLRYYLISNNRQLLSHMYVEHGIVQALIDLPVDDALRVGYEVKTGQLHADEIETLQNWMRSSGAWDAFIEATKWKRLYGGAGVMMLTTQKGNTELQIDKLNKYSKIQFRAADMWELYYSRAAVKTTQVDKDNVLNDIMYDYYGIPFHPSRVLKLVGKKAPSFIAQQMRGWGMSECERMVRSLNAYLKNNDVIYALLDEAKIDVYRIKDFNSTVVSPGGAAKVAQRVQSTNMMKNYDNAIVLDYNDEYAQKALTFSGLAEMLQQIRIGVAADLRMPLTKLFGQSATGFSSGEEDTENYNSMLESEIRSKSHNDILKMLNIGCQILFGYMPDDLQVEFKPLRILDSEEQEKVKDSQWKRVKEGYENGLVQDFEAKESINRASLLPAEIDENTEANDPLAAQTAMSLQEGKAKLDAKNKPAAKPAPAKKKAANA